jgi:hypothetical protein
MIERKAVYQENRPALAAIDVSEIHGGKFDSLHRKTSFKGQWQSVAGAPSEKMAG